MSKPWEPAFSPTLEEVRQVLQEECQLAIDSVGAFGSGWDNDAYLVNQRYVFRFPRRELAVDLLRREILGLPYVQMGPIEVPVLLFSSLESKVTGRPFVGYELIKGEAAGRLSLPNSQKIRLGEHLAIGLRLLHAVKVPVAAQKALTEGNDWRIDVTQRTELSVKRLSENSAHFKDADGIAEQLLTFKHLEVPTERCLVHGDLYPLHLLMDEGNLHGVIDWGDIHWGTPAQDLSIFFGYLPEASVDDLKVLYGPLNTATMRFAAWRAACHATMLIPFAAETNQPILLAETVAGLERALNWLKVLKQE